MLFKIIALSSRVLFKELPKQNVKTKSSFSPPRVFCQIPVKAHDIAQ